MLRAIVIRVAIARASTTVAITTATEGVVAETAISATAAAGEAESVVASAGVLVLVGLGLAPFAANLLDVGQQLCDLLGSITDCVAMSFFLPNRGRVSIPLMP